MKVALGLQDLLLAAIELFCLLLIRPVLLLLLLMQGCCLLLCLFIQLLLDSRHVWRDVRLLRQVLLLFLAELLGLLLIGPILLPLLQLLLVQLFQLLPLHLLLLLRRLADLGQRAAILDPEFINQAPPIRLDDVGRNLVFLDVGFTCFHQDRNRGCASGCRRLLVCQNMLLGLAVHKDNLLHKLVELL